MTLVRGIVLTLLLSALAGALGVWGGVWYVQARAPQAPSLNEMVHQQLRLTREQRQRIDILERGFAVQRRSLEAQMRAANADLAAAYQASHAYTPQVQAAIGRFLAASDALQRATMAHVIAMRAALTPAQAVRFDGAVVKALTAAGP
ncbi:MAG TPA: periplasmic heavy metal sensor [Caulobacteraceae bacterium]|nr:periplasmic heavy metal sensor [Caulobacteraceae bacterium]